MPATYDLLAVSERSPYLNRWDMTTGLKIPVTDIVGASYDGIIMDTPRDRMFIAHYTSPGISLYDLSGEVFEKQTLPISLGRNSNTGFLTPDGEKYFAAVQNLPVSAYSTASWADITAQYDFPSVAVHGMDISPDGRYLAMGLASVSSGSSLCIIDLATGEQLQGVLSIAAGTSYRCRFSPNGRLLAVTHNSLIGLYVYDVQTWQQIPGISVGAVCYGLDFSPDGQYLALAGRNMQGLIVYRVSDWSRIDNLPAQGNLYTVRFSPDAVMLAIGASSTPYVRVMDVKTWQMLPALQLVETILLQVTAVAFTAPQLGTVSGAIHDIDGNPAARQVRAYRRSDGMLVGRATSDATSGEYSIRLVKAQGPYDIQAMIAEGEQLNDLFYARVTPE